MSGVFSGFGQPRAILVSGVLLGVCCCGLATAAAGVGSVLGAHGLGQKRLYWTVLVPRVQVPWGAATWVLSPGPLVRGTGEALVRGNVGHGVCGHRGVVCECWEEDFEDLVIPWPYMRLWSD